MKNYFFSILFFFIHLSASEFAVANAASVDYRNPFENSNNKVHLEKDWKRILGSEIAVLIDEVCEQSKESGGIFFTHHSARKISANYNKRSRVQTYKFSMPPNVSVDLLQKLVEKDPCILGVSHNRPAYADENPNDPLLFKQLYLNTIDYFPTYSFFFHSSAGIRRSPIIAVIDTGIDEDHNDLKKNLWVNEKESMGLPSVDDDQNGYVDDIHGYNFASNIGSPAHETANDHGTHVAGLAAAVTENNIGIIGIAGPKARIMALNVFGRNLASETVSIDRAIRYAADNGADVINISINGLGESDTTAAAIVYALSKGTMVVVSAGNKNQDIRQYFTFPASYSDRYPGLIAVGAIDVRTKTRCSFSSYHSSLVKIAAPGCDSLAPKDGIYSTFGNNIYGYKSGTSMASPLVAGALALLSVYEEENNLQKPNVADMEYLFLRSMETHTSLENYFLGGKILNLGLITEQIKRR